MASKEVQRVNYPVLFTLRNAIYGNGFLAGVTLSGRGLMTQEDGLWWLHGVRPGAVTAHGNTPAEAFLNFLTSYQSVLFDCAAESKNFESFQADVTGFYNQEETIEEKNWQEALNLLRSGKVKIDNPFFSELPKVDPKIQRDSLAVERLVFENAREYTPKKNAPDHQLAKAA